MTVPKVFLRQGREKSILRKHPWIFSGAIEKVDGNPVSGETVLVLDSRNQILAKGSFSPNSQIRVRIWTFDPSEEIDSAFFSKRIDKAVKTRESLVSLWSTNSCRLIHAESDWLPGVIVDRFDTSVVMQLSSAGAFYWRNVLIDEILKTTKCKNLFEKSDADSVQLEGLEKVVSLHYGNAPEERILVKEHGLVYKMEIEEGQKSGFYLDQRQNRLMIRDYAKGKDVLDCFCYTGGFAMNALVGEANTITAVDSSNQALRLLKENLDCNGMDASRVNLVNENAFEYLRKLRDMGKQFELIILDPPKFAPTTAQVEKAARAYKDINLLAFKLLKRGGTLITFSCSGGVSLPLFQKITADAALDAEKNAQIIRYLHQAEDHPIASTFPEGEYLKGVIWKLQD